jgi:hypothetical protein
MKELIVKLGETSLGKPTFIPFGTRPKTLTRGSAYLALGRRLP